MTNTLTKTIILAAPRETVWDYLTQPDLLAKWFHPPKVAMQEGAKLEMFGAESGDKLIWGDIRTARKPEYLEYTFTVAPMGDAVSVVKWTLDAVESGTRLTLEHEGMPAGADGFGVLMAIDKGWDEHMGRMRADIND